jgi:hypothetical protein
MGVPYLWALEIVDSAAAAEIFCFLYNLAIYLQGA